MANGKNLLPAPRLVLAALVAGALAGAVAVYVRENHLGNAPQPAVAADSQDEVACAAKADTAKKIAASATGQVAALLPADPPQSLKALAFEGADGKPMTLADFAGKEGAGKTLLVNLWATWCAPCIKEMPTLDALAAREAGKIAVVAIAQDMEPAKVTEFWTKGGYKALKPSLDPKLGFSTTLGANLPMTILYDADGKEVWRVAGVREWADAETAKALAEAS